MYIRDNNYSAADNPANAPEDRRILMGTLARSILLAGLLFAAGMVLPVRAQVNVDSLKEALTRARGQHRIEVLLALVQTVENDNPEQAIRYGREALGLLKSSPDRRLESDILAATGWPFVRMNRLDSALVYAERAETAARTVGYRKGIAAAAFLAGRAHRDRSEFNPAVAALERAKVAAEQSGEERLLIEILNETGSIHRRRGEYDRALEMHLEALEIAGEIEDHLYAARTQTYLAIIYDIRGDYDRALEANHQALSVWEEIGDRRRTAAALNNIGILHQHHHDFEKALMFYGRALEIWEQTGGQRSLASTLNNMGATHSLMGHPDEALDHYKRALSIYEELEDRDGAATALNNIGSIYEEKGDLNEALQHLNRSLALSESVEDRGGTADALNRIGIVYRKMGKLGEAEDAVSRSLQLAREMAVWPMIRDASETLSGIYEDQGRFTAALSAYKDYKAAYDSVFSAESRAVVAELQERYHTAEQQQLIESLQREREMQRLWLATLLVGLCLLILVIFLLYNRYRIKNKAHRELADAHERLKRTQAELVRQEKLASLGQLTAGIAHEIKNPLNFVNNFAQVSSELAVEIDAEISSNRGRLEEIADDLQKMLRDLKLTSSKITEHGVRADRIVRAMMAHARQEKSEREKVDLNQLVTANAELAYHGWRARVMGGSVEIEYDLAPDVGQVVLQPQEIGRVLLNLLANAFDAVHEEAIRQNGQYRPLVRVVTRRAGNQVEIRIEDNGPGIADSLREKIFEPFFTTKPAGKGTGLGLSMAYDIITNGHGGVLETIDEEGKGAVFSIKLPCCDQTTSNDSSQPVRTFMQ